MNKKIDVCPHCGKSLVPEIKKEQYYTKVTPKGRRVKFYNFSYNPGDPGCYWVFNRKSGYVSSLTKGRKAKVTQFEKYTSFKDFSRNAWVIPSLKEVLICVDMLIDDKELPEAYW